MILSQLVSFQVICLSGGFDEIIEMNHEQIINNEEFLGVNRLFIIISDRRNFPKIM